MRKGSRCTFLVAICLLHSAFVFAAAPFNTRSESKKSLGPDSEKELEKLADDGHAGKKEQLTRQLEWVLELAGEVKISTEEKAALLKDAEPLIEAAIKTWRPRYIESLRFYIVSYTDDASAARRIAQWKMDQAEKRLTVEGWTLPDLSPAWQELVKKHLGEERGAQAIAIRAKQRAEVKLEMESFLERWASTGRVPMDEELRLLIESLRKELKLEQPKVDDLFTAAKKLVDEHVASELIAGLDLLSSLPEEQRLVAMGQGNSFATRFVRPKGTDIEKKWAEVITSLLGAEPVKQWQKLVAEQKTKEEADLVDSLKPSEAQAQMQMEELIGREVESYVSGLNLDDERKKQLEALGKQAVTASIEASKKQWIKTIQGWSTADRKNRRNSYFGVSDEDQPPKQKVWADGLKKIFSPEELQNMQEGLAQRKTRMSGALAAATLAEMDKTLALSVKQRADLEPLLRPLMEPLLRDESQEYWSYQAYQLCNTAAKVDEKQLTAILDDVQVKQWKTLVSMVPNNSRSGGITVTSSEIDPEEEKPDVEWEISRHLHQLGVNERKRLLEVMLAQVGDAKRVLNLPDEKVKRLSTAAKGAVEASMEEWRTQVESWVRNSVERATPATVKATLTNLARSTYNTQGKGPHTQDRWRETITTLLSESEQTAWKEVLDARKAYRTAAMATMSVNELDRRRRLTPEQVKKVHQLVSKVLNDYLPDIERYMNHSWHLQYYYALLPLAGVKEADLKSTLTERQWKLVQERDLSDALQYWEGIESYHKQRLEQDKNAEGGAGIFDE
ncbi:MAG: hypothetical protein IPK22_06330 [Verrucomicrobiaceae bacterium]|nr:hypothetical protein [Verrucomicrobiaceae bacterium]